ncbi:MAG: phospholipase [Micrococcales bacterium]|nr:phospholipase [Micrococcales bacterium]
MPALDPDAVQWSAPERERAGRPLLVLAHGRGADERDLFALSPHLPLRPVIASVRAIHPEGAGYSWFDPAHERRGAASGAAADTAAGAVLDWLDTVDTGAGVGMLGFSQGAVVATQLLRLAPRRLDYVVALSGYVAQGEHPGDVRLRELPPPVFWGRGGQDRVIPETAVEWSLPWMATHTTLTERVYPDLGHSVGRAELRDISAWLEQRLG